MSAPVDMFVSLSPQDTVRCLVDTIRNRNISADVVDCYEIAPSAGYLVYTLVLQKYYYRNGNYASLTVTIDNLAGGATRVHAVSAGGAGGLIKLSWGAESHFAGMVLDALRQYAIAPRG